MGIFGDPQRVKNEKYEHYVHTLSRVIRKSTIQYTHIQTPTHFSELQLLKRLTEEESPLLLLFSSLCFALLWKIKQMSNSRSPFRQHLDETGWFSERQSFIESAVSTAIRKTTSAQPDEPLSYISQELINILVDDKTTDDATTILRLRNALQILAVAEKTVLNTLKKHIPLESTVSRSGYLHSLRELVGPCPDHMWQEEWTKMLLDLKQNNGELERQEDGTWTCVTDFRWAGTNVSKGTVVDESWIKKYESVSIISDSEQSWANHYIKKLVDVGWEREDAVTVVLLCIVRMPISRAVRKREGHFAASAYALCKVLATKCAEQEQKGIQKLVSYRCLRGPYSLSYEDPAWESIEIPDSTGFCGICSLNVVKGLIDPDLFSIDGMKMWNQVEQRLQVIDSPIVGFEPALEDEQGYHSAVLLEQSDENEKSHYEYVFPPNCLFRIKRVESDGFKAPNGIFVKQKLIIVTATFLSPFPKDLAHSEQCSKLCANVNTLAYGDRNVFIDGLNALIPPQAALSMSFEFDRDTSWTDWKGKRYSLREEWKYVNGTAQTLEGCTPGTRDVHNAGRTLHDFFDLAHDHVAYRRSQGCGLNLCEQAAYLTLEEVVAIRLYSGPCYWPINTFLRQVAAVTGIHREALVSHPLYTFAATCRHLSSAIRKLAAVATIEQASTRLYRGVRGELNTSFWVKDEQGLICAVDTAFLSCSQDRKTPINYMSELGGNVLWEIQCEKESDVAFHSGADISFLSQFTDEREVLFPPCTMLSVLKGESSKQCEEEGKVFESILVKPCFV